MSQMCDGIERGVVPGYMQTGFHTCFMPTDAVISNRIILNLYINSLGSNEFYLDIYVF